MDTLQTSDEELVRLVQNGNIPAFEILVKRYSDKLVRVAFRILHDRASAEDVALETLFRIYQDIERVDSTRKFSSFLYASCKNNAISNLRKIKPSQTLDEVENIESDEDTIESFIIMEQRAKVEQSLKKLPPIQEKVLRLYYYDDVSYEEIAKKLSMPINTVRTHIRRAKEHLKHLFAV